MFICEYVTAMAYMWQSENCASWFSPSTMWIVGNQAWQQVPKAAEPSYWLCGTDKEE